MTRHGSHLLSALLLIACGGDAKSTSPPTDGGVVDGHAIDASPTTDAQNDAPTKPRSWAQAEAFVDYAGGRLAAHATEPGRVALAGRGLIPTTPKINLGELRNESLADTFVASGADPDALLDLTFIGNDIAMLAFGGDPKKPSLGIARRSAGTWKMDPIVQPLAGGWPPRQLLASGTRLLAIAESTVIDLTDPSATFHPTWVFNSSVATKPDASFSAAAVTATEGRLLLASDLFHTLRHCALGVALECDTPVTPTGLPMGDFRDIFEDAAHGVVLLRVNSNAGPRLTISRDGGKSFLDLGDVANGANAVSCDPKDARTASWTDGATIHYTTDAGVSIETIAPPTSAGADGALAVDVAGTIWLLDRNSELWSLR